ncbi:MAG: hypothetical protein AB2A00_21975 [Myxococcota bacterium]
MATLIDLTHARRGRRLLHLMAERYGISWFLEGGREKFFKLDPGKIETAVEMCAHWLLLRTGSEPNATTRAWLKKDLRRTLIQRLAESMVNAGY